MMKRNKLLYNIIIACIPIKGLQLLLETSGTVKCIVQELGDDDSDFCQV